MITKSFLKSSVVFTLGGALPMLASIIMLPFYTNYLSNVQYTQVLFYVSISLLFQILFSFSIESYFGIRYTQLADEPESQKRFIGTTTILLISIGVGLLLLSAIFGDMIFEKIYRTDLDMHFWPYGFYSVLTAFFNSYFKVATISLIYVKRAKLFLIVNVINFLVTILISIGGLYFFPYNILGPMYGRLISGAVIFIMAWFILSRQAEFVFDKTQAMDIAKFCGPYVFFVICVWVLGQIDRYLLVSFISNEDLNAYDLILKCFFGIEFLQNSLTAVLSPEMYKIWSKTKVNATTPETNRYINVFTALNILQLILFCIFIPFIYKLVIANPAFYRAESYIGILAAGYALKSIFIFYFVTILYTKRIDVLMKVFGLSALLQIVATVIAVKYYGLSGAIYTGLAIKFLQVVFAMIFTKSIFRYVFNYFKIVVIPILFVVINLLQFIFMDSYSLTFYLLQLVFFSIIIYLVFRNEIKKALVGLNFIKG